MANTRTSRCYLNTTNIAQVLRNRLERNKSTYIINPDGTYFISYKGYTLTPDEFDAMLPVNIRTVTTKGEGCSSHQKLVA